jgi:hypothetical protein
MQHPFFKLLHGCRHVVLADVAGYVRKLFTSSQSFSTEVGFRIELSFEINSLKQIL